MPKTLLEQTCALCGTRLCGIELAEGLCSECNLMATEEGLEIDDLLDVLEGRREMQRRRAS